MEIERKVDIGDFLVDYDMLAKVLDFHNVNYISSLHIRNYITNSEYLIPRCGNQYKKLEIMKFSELSKHNQKIVLKGELKRC